MSQASNPAPGFSRHPDHRVTIAPARGRVRAMVRSRDADGTATVLADSGTALEVRESRYPPVWYFPRRDVEMALLQSSESTSYCPFKGHASYFSIALPDRTLDDAAWSYQQPYDECQSLRDHVAFYADRVTIETVGAESAG